MIYESRDESGLPEHRTVCIYCGVMGDAIASGLDAAREAIIDGWVCLDGWYACPDCKTVDSWTYKAPVPKDFEPVDAAPPEWRCPHCGQGTKSRRAKNKKCPRCKEILWKE